MRVERVRWRAPRGGCGLLVAAGLALAWMGCSARAPLTPLPGPLGTVPVAEMGDALEPATAGVLLAAMDLAPEALPLARVHHGATACRGHRGVNPLAIPDPRGPRVGAEWTCLFVTSACPVPAEPAWPCWIVTSARALPSPIDFSAYGMPGCWLLVQPDQIVAVPPQASSGMLRRAAGSGQVRLHWTPAPGSAGATHWFQFVTLSPSGFLSSAAVEVVVGSGRP